MIEKIIDRMRKNWYTSEIRFTVDLRNRLFWIYLSVRQVWYDDLKLRKLVIVFFIITVANAVLISYEQKSQYPMQSMKWI